MQDALVEGCTTTTAAGGVASQVGESGGREGGRNNQVVDQNQNLLFLDVMPCYVRYTLADADPGGPCHQDFFKIIQFSGNFEHILGP